VRIYGVKFFAGCIPLRSNNPLAPPPKPLLNMATSITPTGPIVVEQPNPALLQTTATIGGTVSVCSAQCTPLLVASANVGATSPAGRYASIRSLWLDRRRAPSRFTTSWERTQRRQTAMRPRWWSGWERRPPLYLLPFRRELITSSQTVCGLGQTRHSTQPQRERSGGALRSGTRRPNHSVIIPPRSAHFWCVVGGTELLDCVPMTGRRAYARGRTSCLRTRACR